MSDTKDRRKRPKPPQDPNPNKDDREGTPRDNDDLPEGSGGQE